MDQPITTPRRRSIWIAGLAFVLIAAAAQRAWFVAATHAGPLPRLQTVAGTPAAAYAARCAPIESSPSPTPRDDAAARPGARAPVVVSSARGAAAAPARNSRTSAAPATETSAAPHDLHAMLDAASTGAPNLTRPGSPALPDGAADALRSLGGADGLDLGALLDAANGGAASGRAPSDDGTGDPATGLALDGPLGALLDGGGGGVGGGMLDLLLGGSDAPAGAPLETSPMPRWWAHGVTSVATTIDGEDTDTIAPWWPIAGQALLGWLALVATLGVTRRVAGARAAVIAGALALGAATFITPELILGPAPLVAALALGFTWALHRTDDESALRWVSAGALLGALVLTDPTWGPFGMLMMVGLRFSRRRINDRLRPAVPFALGFSAVVMLGALAIFDAVIDGGPMALLGRGLATPTGTPITWFDLVAHGDATHGLSAGALATDVPWLRWFVLSPLVIVPWAVAGALTGRRRWWRPAPLLLMLGYVALRAGVLGPTAADRVLVAWLLLPWAALGVDGAIDAVRSRRWTQLVAPAGAVAAVIAAHVAVAPAPPMTLRDADRLAHACELPRAQRALARGEWTVAHEAYVAALARYPDADVVPASQRAALAMTRQMLTARAERAALKAQGSTQRASVATD